MIILCTRGPIHCIMYKHAHESRNKKKTPTKIIYIYRTILWHHRAFTKKKKNTSNQSFWVGQTIYQPNAWCDVMTLAAIFNSPFAGSSSTTVDGSRLSVMYCLLLAFFFLLCISKVINCYPVIIDIWDFTLCANSEMTLSYYTFTRQ